MEICLATEAHIRVFRDSKFDGIMGLGLTMDRKAHLKGQSVIDRLRDSDKCKEKIFIYNIQENGGSLDFCGYPDYIKNKDDIRWSPQFKYDAASSWGVSIRNIRVEVKKRRYNRIRPAISQRKTLRTAKKAFRSRTGFRTVGSRCELKPDGHGCEFLVDTGTDLTYVPRKMYYELFKEYRQEDFEDCKNYFRGRLPDIIFDVIGNFY